MRILLCKIFQRRLYDLFANKQSLLLCCAIFCMTFIAVVHIFELVFAWNRKPDPIGSLGYRCHSCPKFAIDVVYTWVNGSDPRLVTQLHTTRQQIQNSIQTEFESKANNICQELQEKDCQSYNEQNCLESAVALISPVIQEPSKLFDNVTKLEIAGTQGTLVYFPEIAQAQRTTRLCFVSYNSSTYSVRKTHIILDLGANGVNGIDGNDGNKNHKNNGIRVKLRSDRLILVCKLSLLSLNGSTPSKLLRYLSPFARKQVNVINIYEDKHCALFAIKNPIVNSTKLMEAMRRALEKRQTDGQSLDIRHPIDLFVYGIDNDLNGGHQEEDDRLRALSESRFADNQELRYSLRSLEKNANWIRKVFIVTNGQIPNWLNLDNDRIEIITHEEIFANKSHLPSFSSPAIETHLHRIPGLSKRFLYLNDDILIGKPIYPEDFYTESKGFKVYLSWPVPNCADGCPMNWLRDGYCDQACNSSQCLWDGGDCVGNATQRQPTHNGRPALTGHADMRSDGYCSANCVDSWLSDRFCDQVCNNAECGFDLGDCGTDRFNLIYGIDFHPNRHIYYYRSDSTAIYFNFNKYLDANLRTGIADELSEISYQNNSFVRSAAMNMNHKTLVFLFYADRQRNDLNVTLKIMRNSSEEVIEFQALVDDRLTPNASYAPIDEYEFNERRKQESVGNANNLTPSDRNLNKTYENISTNGSTAANRYPEYPKILPLDETEFNESHECRLSLDELPDQLKSKIKDLDLKFKSGILTEKGVKNFRQRLIRLYINQLCDYQKTVKTFDTTVSAFDWERAGTLAAVERSISRAERKAELIGGTDRLIGRHLMDSYADSLRHVNQLYNRVFGIEMRKVPAHMAHFVDTDVMTRLQHTFPNHFDVTSSHRIRSSDDMQFAFAYNYYLMNELKPFNVSQLFDRFDVDRSGTWSINELRTVIVNVYESPLKLESFKEFYEILFFCCIHSADYVCNEVNTEVNISQHFERGLESYERLEIPKSVIELCPNASNKLSQIYSNEKRNKFEILGEEDITFKMIKSNSTILSQELDQLSRHSTKFMCLNDNIDHKNIGDAEVIRVKRMLVQFYESMFPIRSQFELPDGQSNRWTDVADRRQAIADQRRRLVRTTWIGVTAVMAVVLCIAFKLSSIRLSIINWIHFSNNRIGSKHNLNRRRERRV